MLEHKYRAWDIKKNEYIEIIGFYIHDKIITLWFLDDADCADFGNFHVARIILEQYTGKKDIKKTQIFAGDIFKDYTNDGYLEYLVIVWNEKLCGFGVNVYEGKIQEEFFVEFLTMEDYKFELMNIIGNIHA